jgi:hypothetical protein
LTEICRNFFSSVSLKEFFKAGAKIVIILDISVECVLGEEKSL